MEKESGERNQNNKFQGKSKTKQSEKVERQSRSRKWRDKLRASVDKLSKKQSEKWSEKVDKKKNKKVRKWRESLLRNKGTNQSKKVE